MAADFRKKLLAWFDHAGRHNLPWQNPRDAYRVWLSEVMLQQTQVVTVIAYFERFIARFPTVHTLAAASIDEVLALWAGLGYYTRAKNLHRCARLICDNYQGRFPEDITTLMTLPGIGRSTAGAIVAQAFGRYGVILDGNVRRVLIRVHALHGDPTSAALQQQLWSLAETYTPKERVADYSQAIMDLGALVCTRSRPRCNICPLQSLCQAYQNQSVMALPSKRHTKIKPLKHCWMLVTRNSQQHILLVKRPLSGLWNGLWSLPSLDAPEHLNDWLQSQHLHITQRQTMTGFRHTFSHFSLDIDVLLLDIEPLSGWMVAEDRGEQWFSVAQALQLGIPAPIKRILKALHDPNI